MVGYGKSLGVGVIGSAAADGAGSTVGGGVGESALGAAAALGAGDSICAVDSLGAADSVWAVDAIVPGSWPVGLAAAASAMRGALAAAIGAVNSRFCSSYGRITTPKGGEVADSLDQEFCESMISSSIATCCRPIVSQ